MVPIFVNWKMINLEFFFSNIVQHVKAWSQAIAQNRYDLVK